MVLPLIALVAPDGYNGVIQLEGSMDYLTTKETAVLLNISPRGVRKQVERGNISATVVSGLMLIKKIEVDRFLKNRKPRKVKSVESEGTNSKATVG